MGKIELYKGVEYPLEDQEILAIKVALPKNQRNGKFSEKGLFKVEARHRNLFLDRGKISGKASQGRQGWMTVEDFQNKNFAPYGLGDVAARLDSAIKGISLQNENSSLQDMNIEKDATIARLLAENEALKASTLSDKKDKVETKKEKDKVETKNTAQ